MLYLFYEGGQPLGIFDFSEGILSQTIPQITVDAVQGGMIGMFDVATPAGTIPLGDGFDEYGASTGGFPSKKTVIVPATGANRVGVTTQLLIIDDGHTGYGTMFGHQFGHETGPADYKYYHAWREGKLVGPNTIAGSGKATGWFTPGVYGTDYWEASAVLDPENPPAPGTPLYIDTDYARLCAIDSANTPILSTVQTVYFVSFLGDPSYVSTSFEGGTIGGDTQQPVMLFMWK
jgi:hypothetical protein